MSETMGCQKRDSRRRYDATKRTADLVVGALLLVLSAPVQVGVALFVAARLGRPVLFRHVRPGRGGKPFTLLKFRSMLGIDHSNGLVTNEQRLTRFGRVLRATSLDELPSLLNVVRGDMSLVGPRPLRMDYLPRYSPRQARRHEVRPGITGLAQVSGRNAIGWDEKLELDVRYVEARSLRLDILILFRTVAQVLHRRGITGDGLAATSAFIGQADRTGLVEEPLDETWLGTRVSWLRDERVSSGVSLGFVPELEATRRWFSVVAKDQSRRDWVYATEHGEPVAMCGLNGVGTPDASLYLYVNPDLHSRGYGRASLVKLALRAQSLGVRRLHLEVRERNAPAVSLYRKVGFVPEEVEALPAGKLALVLNLDPTLVSRLSAGAEGERGASE